MKKLLPIIHAILFCSPLFAQTFKGHPIRINSIAATQPHKVIEKFHERQDNKNQVSNDVQSRVTPSHKITSSANETIIGTTTYEIQTNGTISNRLVNYNGHLSAVWTMSLTGGIANGWLDRGTGYNFSGDDGATWLPQPTSRLESVRTGFTNVAYSGGREGILAHTISNGLSFTSRTNQGTGSWSSLYLPGTSGNDEWTKLAAGGSDGHSFHVIWGGIPNSPYVSSLHYSRSINDGASWSLPADIPQYLVGTDVFNGIGNDAYSIDARGDVIAIVVGDLGGKDLVLLKSLDNGNTWAKTIVQQFIIPMYDETTMNTDTNSDGLADTLFTNVGDAALVIDNNNIVHVFFGGTRLLEQPGETALGYFPTTDLYYWNENLGQNNNRLLTHPPDLNGDGIISLPTGCNFDPAEYPVGYYGTGLMSFIEMPNAGVDTNNNIYLSYQAVDELSDTNLYGMAFMHPYIIKSMDNGNTWTNPDSAFDILMATQSLGGQSLDGAFAAMAKHVDSKVHIIYQRDFATGVLLTSGFPCNYNDDSPEDVVYVGIDISDIAASTNDIASTHSFIVSSNYPNPFHGKTSFDINMEKANDVSVEVSDLLGQIISVNKYSNLNTGSHTLTIDATKFASGVYTYKVKAGNDVVSKKMIVQ